MNVQTMALDVSKAAAVPPTLVLRQGDRNATTLNVGIYDNGQALDLTLLPVRLCAKLPDGEHYYSVDGTAAGNTATFALDETYAAAYVGVTDLAYVDVLDGDEVICSTQPFRLEVLPGAREGVVPSEEHIAEIDAAVERCNEAAEECESLANPITDAQIDSIVADTAVTSTNKLDATGLTYFWAKLKAWFAARFAPLASPALTGTPTAPTAASGTDTAQIATTAFVQDAVSGAVPASEKGAAGGVAELDANGILLTSQLPSYVDDVIEAASASAFPAQGEAGKIYVALDTNKTYRWSGSSYVEISPSLALGETASTAYRGDRGAQAYAHGVTNKGVQLASGLWVLSTNAEGHVTAGAAATGADVAPLISGQAIAPASVAATGAVSGSSISDGVGTLAALRESVSHTKEFISAPTTFSANNVTSVNFDAAEAGYVPIGIIQQQFSVGSAYLAITNCIVDGSFVKIGAMNRDSAARTATLKIVVLYRKS